MKSEQKAEALLLATEILKNIELGELALSSIVFKCLRLARLNDDEDYLKLFEYESAGYPGTAQGMHQGAFELARKANRVYDDARPGKSGELAFTHTVGQLDAEIDASRLQMSLAADPPLSVSSANPSQFVSANGNAVERSGLRTLLVDLEKKRTQLRAAYYKYVLQVHNALKFGSAVESVLERASTRIETFLAQKLPSSLQKFSSIQDNLTSDNNEDWTSAVTSARRILKDLADKLFPPSDDTIKTTGEGGKEITISLDDQHYKARLKEFIRRKSGSRNFTAVVGSNLEYIADRIDCINDASSKGVHADVSLLEAEQYVIYVFLLAHDILTLEGSELDVLPLEVQKDESA